MSLVAIHKNLNTVRQMTESSPYSTNINTMLNLVSSQIDEAFATAPKKRERWEVVGSAWIRMIILTALVLSYYSKHPNTKDWAQSIKYAKNTYTGLLEAIKDV